MVGIGRVDRGLVRSFQSCTQLAAAVDSEREDAEGELLLYNLLKKPTDLDRDDDKVEADPETTNSMVHIASNPETSYIFDDIR